MLSNTHRIVLGKLTQPVTKACTADTRRLASVVTPLNLSVYSYPVIHIYGILNVYMFEDATDMNNRLQAVREIQRRYNACGPLSPAANVPVSGSALTAGPPDPSRNVE